VELFDIDTMSFNGAKGIVTSLPAAEGSLIVDLGSPRGHVSIELVHLRVYQERGKLPRPIESESQPPLKRATLLDMDDEVVFH